MREELIKIEEVYDGFIETLIDGFVYYILQNTFNKETLADIQSVVEDDFFDKLHVSIKDNFEGITLSMFLEYQFEKRLKLERTYFELLRLQKILSEQEFKSLAYKYLDYVEFLTSFTTFMVDNLSAYTKEENDLFSHSIFSNQQNQLLTHLGELIDSFAEKINFPITDKQYSIEELLMKYVPNFVVRYTKFVKTYGPDKEVYFDTKEKRKSIKRNKKQTGKNTREIITEEEAERFLLETVFNVKLNN